MPRYLKYLGGCLSPDVTYRELGEQNGGRGKETGVQLLCRGRGALSRERVDHGLSGKVAS